MTSEQTGWPPTLDERFTLEKRLARGRMSTVFRARDGERQVALKVLHEHLRDNPSVRQRLSRELAATRRLNHPNILRVDDLLETDDVVALVMEYVDGRTLRQFVQEEGPQSWERTREILKSVARAIGHAHDRGILHRDLSAHHVMISAEGEVKVVGFGLARVDELVGLTMHTRVLGALESLAPERILGFSYDGRADLYSLGTLGHELLAGEPLLDRGMSEAFLRASGKRGSALPEHVSAEARYVLERCLATDPSTRFATADQLLRALDGDYDLAGWNAWSARQTRGCPQCEEPIIDGLAHCIHCNFAFKRLVQSPGAGDFMIRVLSKHEAFVKDVPFEVNTEPTTLTESQFENLMEFLKEYDDTAPFADGRWEYFFPPYILINQLSGEEALRISELLKERGIDSKVTQRQGRKKMVFRNQSSDFSGDNRALTVLPLIYLTMGLLMAVTVFGLSFTSPAWFAIATFLTVVGFFSGMVAPRLLRPVPAERDQIEKVGALSLMIPARELSSLGQATGDAALPKRTAAALRSFSDDGLRREIFELIVLTLQLASTEGDSARRTVDEILSVAEAISDIDKRLRERPTAQLVDELEALEARLSAAQTGKESAPLIDEKAALLAALAERDELEHRRAALGARLLRVRATLFDHRRPAGSGPGSGGEDEVVFDFSEVHHQLQAQEELESLLPHLQREPV